MLPIFRLRMSLVRPQLHTVRAAAKAAATRQAHRERVCRTKSLTHQILGIRFSEVYQGESGGESSRDTTDRPSLVATTTTTPNYGSIAGEYRNGAASGGRRRHSPVGLIGRPNGNLLLGGELQRGEEMTLDDLTRQSSEESSDGGAGDRRCASWRGRINVASSD